MSDFQDKSLILPTELFELYACYFDDIVQHVKLPPI